MFQELYIVSRYKRYRKAKFSAGVLYALRMQSVINKDRLQNEFF